jgi:hypothetical protein
MTSLENEEINRQFANVASELSSSYATYPLAKSHWVDHKGTTATGEPCFVANAEENAMEKPDYVHGNGPLGRGYYHLLTRQAYAILYGRLTKSRPSGGCCCFGTQDVKDAASDHDDVQTIMYYRSVASKPDDFQAVKDAIAKAEGVADSYYNITQTEQLIVMAVT